MAVELIVTAGPHAGRTFAFAEHATFLVGRSSQAHFSLPELDPHVSRLHAVVEVNPPLCRVRNLSRVNGTVVNDTRVEEADLADGDRVRIGLTEITVRLRPVTDGGGTLSTVGLSTDPRPRDPATVTAARAAVTPTAPGPPDPPVVPGYRTVRELGHGGMGVVFEAVRVATGETLAMKFVLPRAAVSATALTKFLREADILRQLNDPLRMGVGERVGQLADDPGRGGQWEWFARLVRLLNHRLQGAAGDERRGNEQAIGVAAGLE